MNRAPSPGEVVRYRGRPVVVTEVGQAWSPYDRTVAIPIIQIDRPRAGRKWVMLSELEEPDAVPEARQTTEDEGPFRSRHP